ncbi:peptidoglycan editing factor PgeF [Paraburkholderia sp. NMBU_R16]|uniref:peptidoglycan editing factor PgeF n=1 Tax=Paraburkholderia sp. NMBU_R16 TaxID=2698676 RepID=UPI0015668C61|nr:peptidoglycan editing factor PgeF [Paraburkholderia sp. NMBU_R16]NRO96752.1 peptidoglycan editing factor PgeF [Paraburkholderia sp. NMBU_R16]
MNRAELTQADCVVPSWQVSPRVRALVTTRAGGVSLPPYGRFAEGVEQHGGLNLGLHTGDDPERVAENRARLAALTGARVAWLDQVHGDAVASAQDAVASAQPLLADACVTAATGLACTVMVADCLPVLLCDPAGRAVGAAHAGWRGLAAGVVEKAAERVAQLAGIPTASLHAWLGPAIGPRAFEVGAEVRDAFMQGAGDARDAEATVRAFVPRENAPGKYWADLYALARLRLARLGLAQVGGGGACTVTERERFYSFRRDGRTGRMAALIWLADRA